MSFSADRAGRDARAPSRWRRRAGVPLGPNPRVGCVLLDADGRDRRRGLPPRRRQPARRGRRAGPGRRRGARARPPWSPSSPATTPAAPARAREALRRGRRTPRGLRPAPTPTRSPTGGAETAPRRPASRSRPGLLADEARALNRVWTFAVEHGRPFVTWKFATTLDGRSAAADGTSRWVSSRGRPARHAPAARAVRHDAGRHQHRRRRRPAADRPRRATTSRCRAQPLRVVMGERDLDPDRRIFDDAAETLHLRTRDPEAALKDAVRPRPAARLPRGRPDPRGGVPARRAGRRGRRLRRADAARRRPQRRRPTWESPRSPTRCDLPVTDVTVLAAG